MNFNKRIIQKLISSQFSILISFFLLFFLFFLEKTQAQSKFMLKTLVVDAGHGGKDPGAIGKKSYEKNIVLKIALKFGKLVETEYPQMNVIYTRKKDEFIELHERAQIANRNNADLFISIHVNASTRTEATGTSTYVMGLNSSDKNMAVAKRENSVISIETNSDKYKGFNTDTPENNIILQLRQNTNINQSILLASKVQHQLKYYAKRKDRGVYQAGLIVLYNTAMPGILIETGFISNVNEEIWLNTEKGQNLIAMSIFRAFKVYKDEVEAKSTGSFVFDSDEFVNKDEKSEKVTKETSVKTDPISVKTKESSVKKEEINNEALDTDKEVDPNIVYYRVQFKTSTKKLDLNSLGIKGFPKVDVYVQSGSYKYVCGNEKDYQEALKLLTQVKKKYKDAFIVRFKNGKRI